VREGGARLPVALVEAARAVLGHIDVDPASSAETNLTVGAGVWFAPADGLTHEWPGRVFLHPARDQAQAFVRQLLDQYRRQVTSAAIVVLGTGPGGGEWFQPLLDYLLCFPAQRQVEGSSHADEVIHGSLVYLGAEEARFIDRFRQFGPIVKRVDRSGAHNS
jgi:ParB family chromosome partitioning protein